MPFAKFSKTGCCLLLISVISILSPAFPSAEETLTGTGGPDGLSPEMEIRSLLISEIKTILSGEIAARIDAIRVDMGDRFKLGDPLVLFECDLYQAKLDMATSEFKAASKALEVHRKLAELHSASELEIVEAETRMEIARSEIALQQAQVNRCVIPAPFDGRVIRRIANPFEYVSPGQPLLEVIDDVNLRLQLFVPSKWLQWIKPGAAFDARIDETGKTYKARVKSINAGVDPVSQTVELRAVIDGQHPELLAGMSGSCLFKK